MLDDKIKKIQDKFHSDNRFLITVFDLDKNGQPIEKITNDRFKEEFSGQMSVLLNHFKDRGYCNLNIRPRLPRGRVTRQFPGMEDLQVQIEPADHNTAKIAAPPAHETPPTTKADFQGLAAPGYAMAKSEILDREVAKQDRQITSLNDQVGKLTDEKDKLKDQNRSLSTKLEIAEKDLATEKAKSKRLKKKLQKPKGLAGASPEVTALLIQQAPQIIEALGIKAGAGSKQVTAVSQGPSPGHQQVFDRLKTWPESYMPELLVILDKYEKDEEFVKNLRSMVGLQVVREEAYGG